MLITSNLKKYVDDIISSLNAKNKLCKKSGSSNDQIKLKFLEAEILEVKSEHTSLKNDNKSKLKTIESLTFCQCRYAIVNNEKLHVKPLTYQNLKRETIRNKQSKIVLFSTMIQTIVT